MRPGPGLRLLISKKRRGVRGSHQKAAGACIAAGCEVNNARAATSRPGRTQDHTSKQAGYSALALAGKTYAMGGLRSHARGQSVDSRLTPDRMRPGSYREFGRFPRAPFRARAMANGSGGLMLRGRPGINGSGSLMTLALQVRAPV